MAIDDVQALTFDVFGTVVDWRQAIISAGEAVSAGRGWRIDWPACADAWRGLYRPYIDRVLSGERPWARFDDLQRAMLLEVLDTFGIRDLDDGDVRRLAAVWSRMDGWPDVISGLNRLRHRYMVCALSNGSIGQLVRTSKHAGLAWDVILSVELFRTYKPDQRVYLGAAELLQLEPGQVMMVAAHLQDLRAARSHGLRTAFVSRPREWGPKGHAEQPDPGEFDLVATDFDNLAAQLDA